MYCFWNTSEFGLVNFNFIYEDNSNKTEKLTTCIITIKEIMGQLFALKLFSMTVDEKVSKALGI